MVTTVLGSAEPRALDHLLRKPRPEQLLYLGAPCSTPLLSHLGFRPPAFPSSLCSPVGQPPLTTLHRAQRSCTHSLEMAIGAEEPTRHQAVHGEDRPHGLCSPAPAYPQGCSQPHRLELSEAGLVRTNRQEANASPHSSGDFLGR